MTLPVSDKCNSTATVAHIQTGNISVSITNEASNEFIANLLKACSHAGDIAKADKVYIACSYTDMRHSIDGLATIVQEKFNLNFFENCLFLFCGRKKNRLKALYWEGDGFVLLYV